MSKKKIYIKFFTIADYVEEQQWLEKKHQDGWKLVGVVTPCFFIFEEHVSEKMIYQLDFKNEQVTEDYIQLYQDYGWEFCGSCIGWNYFRKLKSEKMEIGDKEIFSDAESKIHMIDKIFKTRMIPVLCLFCAFSILQFYKIYRMEDLWISISWFLIFCAYLYVMVRCSLKLRTLKKNLN